MPSTDTTDRCGHCGRSLHNSNAWYIAGVGYHLGACSLQKQKWLASDTIASGRVATPPADPANWDAALARAEAGLAALADEAFTEARPGGIALDTARRAIAIARHRNTADACEA